MGQQDGDPRANGRANTYTIHSVLLGSLYVKVSVHVQADDAEVVRARHVGDDTLPPLPLLRHPHPHVPVPQLGGTSTGPYTVVTSTCPSPTAGGAQAQALIRS